MKPPRRPLTVHASPEEEATIKRLADELGLSVSKVLLRGLAVLAAEGEELAAREQAEREQGAALLERIRELGHLANDDALDGYPVEIEVVSTRRVVVKWRGNVFQEISGRLVVARQRLDGGRELAFLDGPEPPEPDAAKFFETKVLV